MKQSSGFSRTFWILGIVLLAAPGANGWGEKGHAIVNRLAIQAAASQLPDFMRSAERQLVYNSYEPDRWRAEGPTPMNVAQAPDHFFDSEMWGRISTLEPDRYAFMARLAERKVDLAKVGYLPYSIIENYGRLCNAFRHWRNAKSPEDRESAQANAIFYAGVLGHYVGDSTMPMHLSIHFNGWADGAPNPGNFTMDRTFHNRYENAYVNIAVDATRIRTAAGTPKRLSDVFDAVKIHLDQTFAELEPMYELEKAGEFNPLSPRARGTDFIAAGLARAATMLANLWYTAWIESGEPVPETPRQ
jgi:hypothetical protein